MLLIQQFDEQQTSNSSHYLIASKLVMGIYRLSEHIFARFKKAQLPLGVKLQSDRLSEENGRVFRQLSAFLNMA